MTDPITCPECEGRKGRRYGKLFLACTFCCGRGWVGGEHEPAEPPSEPPEGPPPAWRHRVWSDPYVASTLDCRLCLGFRQVLHLDQEQGTMVVVPCSCRSGPESV